MIKIHVGMKKFTKINFLLLILICCVLLVIVPLLAFISMFAHEGGHGLIVVPAIILNQEIPETPTEGMQENPFKNFPIGIFSLILSFPLGVLANGVLVYLSIKNAKINQEYESIRELIYLSIFLSFSILNFNAILTNIFGSDFSFIVQDFLQFPSDEQWFRYILRIISFLFFPVILVFTYNFETDKILTVSSATYLANTITVEIIVPQVVPILMANFWWLFIIGLPVLIATVAILTINLEQPKSKLRGDAEGISS